MAQLTWRAVLMGSLLGGVLSLTNLYIGLKVGWGFGVAITACILSYTIWTALYKIGLARTPMTILENNCMQSAASSAGYSTGGTLISAFAAYMLLYHQSLPLPLMFAWVFFLAVLGVTMAIPMKRQMINIEQLRFPSGIAAAGDAPRLHSHGNKAARAAKALALAGLLAAMNQFWADGFTLIDKLIDKLKLGGFRLEQWSISTWMETLNKRFPGQVWMDRTVMFSLGPGLYRGRRHDRVARLLQHDAGRAALLGRVRSHPPTQRHHPRHQIRGHRAMDPVGRGFLHGHLRTVQLRHAVAKHGERPAATSAGFSAAERMRKRSEVDALEAPMSWFLTGQVVSLVALAWLAHRSFAMPWWQSTLAVGLSFFLALVACRVTGETDTTPVGAMGKVTQLIFGALSPGHMAINLMSANITAGAATSSADLLTDLKSGYLLGANPRKQFLAQFAGIFAGTVVTVLCFRLLVPDYTKLGTPQFPAPSAQIWKAVAKVLGQGWSELGRLKIWCIAVGGLIGIVLPLLGKLFPKYEKWIPSAAGLGLAWTFQWFSTSQFFLGAVLAYVWEKTAQIVRRILVSRGFRPHRRRLPDGRVPDLLGERPADH